MEQEELVSKSSALLSHVTWSLGEPHLAHLQNGDDYTKLTDFPQTAVTLVLASLLWPWDLEAPQVTQSAFGLSAPHLGQDRGIAPDLGCVNSPCWEWRWRAGSLAVGSSERTEKPGCPHMEEWYPGATLSRGTPSLRPLDYDLSQNI